MPELPQLSRGAQILKGALKGRKDMNSQTSYFQDVIETVEKLSPDDQMLLVEIIRQRLSEQRRDEIARNAKTTLKAVREKRAHFGSVEGFQRDLSGG